MADKDISAAVGRYVPGRPERLAAEVARVLGADEVPSFIGALETERPQDPREIVARRLREKGEFEVNQLLESSKPRASNAVYLDAAYYLTMRKTNYPVGILLRETNTYYVILGVPEFGQVAPR